MDSDTARPARADTGTSRTAEASAVAPVTAALAVTRQCNLACSYCRVVRQPLPREMGSAEWKQALTTLGRLGVRTVSFTGGEPTLLPFLPELIEHATRAAGLTCMLATNCTFTREKISACARAGLAAAIVSIDTPGEAAVDASSEAKSAWAAEKLSLLREAGVPRIIANVLFHRRNVREVPDAVARLTEKGVEVHPLVLHAAAAHHGHGAADWQNRAPDAGLAFRPEDRPALERLSRDLIGLKRDGALIDAGEAFLRALPRHAPGLDWHCAPHPCKLRVEADGTLSCCQDVRGSLVSRFCVADLEDPARQAAFLAAWESDARACPGCLYTDVFHAVEGSTQLTCAEAPLALPADLVSEHEQEQEQEQEQERARAGSSADGSNR